MKTDIDLKKDIYDYIKSSDLVASVSGELLMVDRPDDSALEDIVISVLDSDASSDIQQAIINVNVYVVDDMTDEGQAIEASLRLMELSRLSHSALQVGQGNSGYRFELVSQRIIKVNGRDEHCINNRIIYKQLIKQ
ncbi:MAG: hypothetical protein Q4A64_03380 [Porphyromonadaceae bacterium]|nr:hypothetical protein [Porphyromonadaceae bacterium]